MPVWWCSAKAPETANGILQSLSSFSVSRNRWSCSGGNSGGLELLTGSGVSAAIQPLMATQAGAVVGALGKWLAAGHRAGQLRRRSEGQEGQGWQRQRPLGQIY